MPKRPPRPEATPTDVAAIRALLDLAVEKCPYHGDKLTVGELNNVSHSRSYWENEPCCGTGKLPLLRRRAVAALDRIEASIDG
jgi:hypothetical protein